MDNKELLPYLDDEITKYEKQKEHHQKEMRNIGNLEDAKFLSHHCMSVKCSDFIMTLKVFKRMIGG